MSVRALGSDPPALLSNRTTLYFPEHFGYDAYSVLKYLKLLALSIFCVAAPIALWEWRRILPGAIVEQPKVSYAELIAILLTGLTVAFALFAGIIGVVAVWGYSNIKEEASTAARAAVDASIKAAMDQHNETLGATIKEQLRPVVRDVVREEMPPDLIAGLYAAAFPQTAGTGDVPSERIAEELPDEKP